MILGILTACFMLPTSGNLPTASCFSIKRDFKSIEVCEYSGDEIVISLEAKVGYIGSVFTCSQAT